MTDPLLDGANSIQRELSELPIGPVLLLAPPGCGKTEALAIRAGGLIANHRLAPAQKILAITFSNRARDNLRERLDTRVGWQRSRQRVEVQNFHGFAARVFQAHSNQLLLDFEPEMPDRRWQNSQFNDLDVSWADRDVAKRVLRTSKQSFVDDDDVARAIAESGNAIALEMERRRIADHKLDYDDLIRYGVKLLRIPAVSELYRARFAAVLVDEMQDMTLQQLEMVTLVGSGRSTLAGDPGQGIYSFAGAMVNEVALQFESEDPIVLLLDQNYRSAPAILALVSSLAERQGGEPISCADPEAWTTDGDVRVRRFESTDTEAVATLEMLGRLIGADSSCSVGVMSRIASRRRTIEHVAAARDVEFVCWDRAVDNDRVRGLLKNALEYVSSEGSLDSQLRQLSEKCLVLCPDDDVDLRSDVVEALGAIREAVALGESPAEFIGTLTVRTESVVGPGLHFLTAHAGKGQQFDWVVALGLEDGVLPFFEARSESQVAEEFRVLHVMCSRARHGLVFNVSRTVPTKSGWPKPRDESPFVAMIEPFVTGQGDPTL